MTRWLSNLDGSDDDAHTDVPATAAADLRSRLIAGAVAGAGAAVAGLTLVGALIGLAWILEPSIGGSIVGPTRLAAQTWLLGHGADVSSAGVVVGITPLGLSAALAGCCWFAAGWAGRRADPVSLGELVTVLLTMVVTYTVIGLALVGLGSTSGAHVGSATALPGLVGLSVVVGASSLLRAAGHGRLIHDIAPFPSRALMSGVGIGAAFLLAAGVGAVGIAVAVDRSGYATLTESLAPGWSAGIGLLVVSLLLLPNAALYAVAMLLGPGFAVGSATTVSAFGVTLGLVPGLPITAALPDEPAVPLGALVALLIPILTGVLVGVVVARGLDDAQRAAHVGIWAAVSGLLLAFALALAQWLARGSLGDNGLATIGASPMLTLVAAAALLAPSAGLSGLFLRRWQLRNR